jgi:hypothetical protein
MKKFAGTFSIVLILFLVGFVYYKYYFTYTTGYRSGLLQKFSYKGTIFKTYEGEMILSSIRSNTNVALASEKFLFSVSQEAVAKQLELLQGRMVTVHYHGKNGTLPWRGDSEYIVDSVKLEQ